MNSGLLSGLKPKVLRLLGLTADPQADAGDVWFDSVLKVPKFHDGAAVQQLVPQSSVLESISRILAVGHSHIADTGASQKSFGAIHKFANMFPAELVDLSVGGAVAVLPDVYLPDQVTSVGTVRAGWGWVLDQVANRERNTGINTTLNANTSAGQAADLSTLVVSSTGATVAVQPVIVGRGANAEITYIQRVIDATHVSFYDSLVNAHSTGEPVVAVPDAYLYNKQLVVLEFDWNDMLWMGPTAWGQAFIHCYRSIIARLRESVHWDADSALIRQTTGSWSITTPAAGFASGPKLISATTNGNALTLDIPVNWPANAQLPLFFRTRANGDGALYTITIDGDASHTVTYDTRNINGYGPYNGGAATRAANGVEMSSCYIIRGLSAGAHTIIVTATTIQGTADFMGFGCIPPDLPPMLVLRPRRWYSYAGIVGTLYTPSDSDQATMDTAIVSLVAEFTAPSSTVFGGTAAPDSTLIAVNQDAVLQKLKKYFSYDWVHCNDGGHAEVGNLLVSTISGATIPNRSLIIPTVSDSVKSGAGWTPFGSAGGSNPYRLQAGWANVGTGTSVAAFRKVVPTRMVYLRGEIQRTTDDFTGLNPPIAILPVGLRPNAEQHFTCFGYTGPIQVIVKADGTVQVAGIISNSNTGISYLSLDGISFVAEL